MYHVIPQALPLSSKWPKGSRVSPEMKPEALSHTLGGEWSRGASTLIGPHGSEKPVSCVFDH